jgi:hypothetical protein
MDSLPFHFIGEVIEVIHQEEPMLKKTPHCPDAFVWRAEVYPIVEVLEHWVQFDRRGRFERNMRPSNKMRAARRGSWGVGRFSFRVRVEDGRIFEIYYDRAPRDAADRMGRWFLMGERMSDPDSKW